MFVITINILILLDIKYYHIYILIQNLIKNLFNIWKTYLIYTAVLVSFVLTTYLSQDFLYSGGWRIAFIVAFFTGVIGLYIRIGIPKTLYFEKYLKSKEKTNKKNNYIKEFLVIIVLTCLGVVITYTAFVYSSVPLKQISLFTYTDTFLTISASLLIVIITIPLCSYIADLFNRKVVILLSLCTIAITFPIYLELLSHSNSTITFVSIILYKDRFSVIQQYQSTSS